MNSAFRRAVVALLAGVGLACLVLGITQPLMVVEQLYFFTATPSLIDVVARLFQDGELLLATIIALFSMVFPLAKFVALLLGASAPHLGAPLIKALGALGRWSMLDVLLVALVIFAVKTSGLGAAASNVGLWFFAGAAILSLIGGHVVRHRTVTDAN